MQHVSYQMFDKLYHTQHKIKITILFYQFMLNDL